MSYIKHKDKLFQKKSANVFRKRSDGNLRRVSSCNDIRAWSLSRDDKRQYFIDSLNAKPYTNVGKYIPPDILYDMIIKQNNSKLRKCSSIKKSSSDENLSKKHLLSYKSSKLSLPSLKEDNISQTKLELDNLKDIVNDLESKVEIMKKLEEENKQLKAQINLGIKKIESLPDLGGMIPNTDDDKCMQLCNAIDLIRSECSRMKSDVDYLQTKNSILSNKLKRTNSSERILKDRELSVSLESVNNAILKSQLTSKDIKVQKLAHMYEEQNIYIENLVGFIKEMEVAYTWKEEMLLGKLMEFKHLIKSYFDKASEYEARLNLSYEVIKENDDLRKQFRKVNSALVENACFYKTKLRGVTRKAIELAYKIELLLKEIAKRDAKIKELSKFPGRSSMAIRLTQLDEIVNKDFIFEKNKNNVVETFERLKRVLKDLKKEALDDHGYQHPYKLSESNSQTDFIQSSDISIQSSSITSECNIQTDYPDEYIMQFLQFNIIIHIFMKIFLEMKSSLKIEQNSNHEFLEKVFSLSEQLKTNEFEIQTLKDHNEYLSRRIKLLNYHIDEGKKNTDVIVKRSVSESAIFDSVHECLSTNFKISIQEYENYCHILEYSLLNNFENFEELLSIKDNEIDRLRHEYFSSITELDRKNDLLLKSLSNENKINNILANEIEGLCVDITRRDSMIEELMERISFYTSINNTREKEMKNSWTQVIINRKDVNILTSEYSIISKFTDKATQIMSQSEVKVIKQKSKNNFLENRCLKKKMMNVKIRVKGIKNKIIYFKNKLDLAVETLMKLKESNLQLRDINKKAIFDNNRLKTDLNNLKGNVNVLKKKLAVETSKNDQPNNYSIKMQRDFSKFQNEFNNSKNKVFSVCSVNTDLVMYEYEQALLSKDECISLLKDRIERLIELLNEIENEKKMKENNYVENCTQCDIDEKIQEKYLILIKNVKEEYEETISNLKSKNLEEMDSKEKYFRNNLSLLKETYERDIKRIKVANADSLRKIQSFHEDEIKAIKLSQEESKIELNLNIIHEKHKQEIEQIKATYHKLVKEKTDLFAVEKENLQNELKRYMDEKEAQVEEITKKMEENIIKMKKKCKVQMKKMKKESNEALEQLKKEYNSKNEDYSSVDFSDLGQDSLHKPCSMESVDAIGQKDEFLEAKTTTSGFEEDLFDTSICDERRCLVKRIEQLEEQLSANQIQSSENACDSEKRVWIERERCREIGKLLDKELERNEKLKIKLKEEQEKYNQLRLVNQSLIEKLELFQRGQNNDYRIIEKDQSRLTYDGLFDCFETHTDDNYDANFKYI